MSVWTLVVELAFLSVCMDSCAYASVSQCLFGLLCLSLRFSVSVWTLVAEIAILSVCIVVRSVTCSKTEFIKLLQD